MCERRLLLKLVNGEMMFMKIGIPRALLYYYYYPFWKTLFTELGCEVVLSDETNTKIISEGCHATETEICVPIKIYNGHVAQLLKTDVDYIFVPQMHMVSHEYYCPKFLGLIELVKYSFENDWDRFMFLYYDTKTDDLSDLKVHMPLCDYLGVSKKQLSQALKKAASKQAEFRRLNTSGYTVTEAYDIFDGKKAAPPAKNQDLTIALLGYVNNVYDPYVSMDTLKRLREMGVRVITFDMLPEDAVKKDKKNIKEPFWIFARKIYNASKYLIKNGEIDGIIHITAFGCGPDSIIGRLMEGDCDEANIPFLTLRIDEHTGDNHTQTRLEAYIDMLKMRKFSDSKGDRL